MITQEPLLQRYNYDELSGLLTLRKKVKYLVAEIGDEVGHLTKAGYRSVKLEGKDYKVHRLIWLMKTGSFPSTTIDHIDRVKDNNRWANLREATIPENSCNTKGTGALGTKGVSRHKSTGNYHAQITFKGIKYQKPLKTWGKQTFG